jgi:hypothetical protein
VAQRRRRRFGASEFDEQAEASAVTVSTIIRDCLDAMLHPSVRYDALTSARHRAFMAPRLLGSLAAFAAFPVYLAMRGAPNAIEVAAFAWLMAPILVSYFLSRTGRYESAQILSSIALASLVMMMAISTGGINSFAAVWLVVVPIEAALSASRRIVAFASSLALVCVGILIALTGLDWLPASEAGIASHSLFTAFGIASATIYAAGLAFGAERVASLRGRRSLSPAGAQYERRYLAPSQQWRRAVHLAGSGSPRWRARAAAARSWPVRSRPCRGSSGLSHRFVRCSTRR